MRLFFFPLSVIGALVLAGGAVGQEAWFLEGLSGHNVTALAATPADPRVLYAAIDSGEVFHSADAGSSWVETSVGLPPAAVHVLAVDPGNSRLVYAGTDQGLYRSGDAGASWIQSGDGMAGGAVHALAIDLENPTVVWASANEPGLLHVYRTENAGDLWKSVVIRGPGFGTPSNFDFVRSLVVRPGTSRVYAGWHEIVFWSDDGGAIWNKFLDVNLEVRAMLLDPFDPSLIYAGTIGGGVARSVNAMPWIFGAGLEGSTIASLVADPETAGLLYPATRGGGVYRSLDGARSWLEAGSLPQPADALAFTASDRVLHAGTSGGIYRFGTPPAVGPRLPISPAQPPGPPISLPPRG